MLRTDGGSCDHGGITWGANPPPPPGGTGGGADLAFLYPSGTPTLQPIDALQEETDCMGGGQTAAAYGPPNVPGEGVLEGSVVEASMPTPIYQYAIFVPSGANEKVDA